MPGVHHKPTPELRELVKKLVVHGSSQEEMADRLGICVETLVTHYKVEVYFHLVDVNCKIEDKMYEKALSGDINAMKFWLTHRAGWAPAKSQEDKEKDQRAKNFDDFITQRKNEMSQGKVKDENANL